MRAEIATRLAVDMVKMIQAREVKCVDPRMLRRRAQQDEGADWVRGVEKEWLE